MQIASKRIILIGIAALFLVAFFARAAHRARAAAVGSKSQTMQFDGRTRRYILHVPSGYATSNPGALVLVLHGATQSPTSAETMSRMSDLADKNNFLAVYPSGTSRNPDDRIPTWNSGACCGYAMENKINDVGFLSALIDQLRNTYSIDAKRVYVTGISNGAMMSYRLACELSSKIAGIAPVEGAQDIPCQPSERVSVLIFHGTDDHLVPFNGGSTPFQLGSKRSDASVADAIQFWVKEDGCNGTPAHEETAEVHTDFYTGCQSNTAVSLYAIQGGHHMWPGLTISGNHVPASDLIWQFFAAHPKP
jgi:polyhydroxybutyrate depolymerase